MGRERKREAPVCDSKERTKSREREKVWKKRTMLTKTTCMRRLELTRGGACSRGGVRVVRFAGPGHHASKKACLRMRERALVVPRAQEKDEEASILKIAQEKVFTEENKELVLKYLGIAADFAKKAFAKVQEEVEAAKENEQEGFVSSAKPPPAISEPTTKPQLQAITYGFTNMAERWNSRAAIVGFFSLLLLEAVTHKGLLELLGISVGNGLGFEF